MHHRRDACTKTKSKSKAKVVEGRKVLEGGGQALLGGPEMEMWAGQMGG